MLTVIGWTLPVCVWRAVSCSVQRVCCLLQFYGFITKWRGSLKNINQLWTMTTNLRIGPNAFSFKLKYSAIWPPSKNFPLHRCINDLQGIPWSCSSFHYAIIFRSCWRSPHDTECCYRWHGNRSWAGWGVSEVLRRVRGSGDHESADIRVLAKAVTD